MKLTPIIPIVRRDPFDDPGCTYELKLDGFRGLADTIQGRMLSKNLNRMKKFDSLLNTLPENCIFDGEICVLDSDGRPRSNDLLFGRSDPSMSFSACYSTRGKIFAPCH